MTVDAVIVDKVTVELDELVKTVLLVNEETVLDVMVVTVAVMNVVVTRDDSCCTTQGNCLM